MRLSTSRFTALNTHFLYLFDSIIDETQDVCVLTFVENSAIVHAVRASDGNVYDAFALQHWFKKQNEQTVNGNFLIPGVIITHVDVKYRTLFPCWKTWTSKRTYVHASTQTDTPKINGQMDTNVKFTHTDTNVKFTQTDTNVKFTHTSTRKHIQSTNSAFHPYSRPLKLTPSEMLVEQESSFLHC